MRFCVFVYSTRKDGFTYLGHHRPADIVSKHSSRFVYGPVLASRRSFPIFTLSDTVLTQYICLLCVVAMTRSQQQEYSFYQARVWGMKIPTSGQNISMSLHWPTESILLHSNRFQPIRIHYKSPFPNAFLHVGPSQNLSLDAGVLSLTTNQSLSPSTT